MQVSINKSAIVREILAKKPDISAKEVAAIMAKRGIRFSENLVYNVRAQLKAAGTPPAVKSLPAACVASYFAPPNHKDVIKTITTVKSLASDVGGLDTLRQIVNELVEA